VGFAEGDGVVERDALDFFLGWGGDERARMTNSRIESSSEKSGRGGGGRGSEWKSRTKKKRHDAGECHFSLPRGSPPILTDDRTTPDRTS
jgi:hypothetical protein